MPSVMRRLFWIALWCGAGYACWTVWHRRAEPAASGPPEWPPIRPPGTAASAAGAVATAGGPPSPAPAATPVAPVAPVAGSEVAGSEVAAARWVAPENGGCPLSHPIKANANSGIYHVPGGRSYARTSPERCYAEPADAEADGYRAAKT